MAAPLPGDGQGGDMAMLAPPQIQFFQTSPEQQQAQMQAQQAQMQAQPQIQPPAQPPTAPDTLSANLSQNFKSILLEMRLQGLVALITPFEGESARNFRLWLRDMEKVGMSVGNDDDRLKVLAIQTLKGPAAQFVSRTLRSNPTMAWPQLKQALLSRFSDISDTQVALQSLKRATQRQDESVQSFSERIITLGEEAFETLDLSHVLIQQQLVDAFIQGVRDDKIARRIIEKRPETLALAVKIATNQQMTNKTFQLRRQLEEPMDVSQIESRQRLAKLEGAVQNLQGLLGDVLAIDKAQGPPNRTFQNQRKKSPFKWTPDGKPVCAFCGKIGHIRAKCWSKNNQHRQQRLEPGN